MIVMNEYEDALPRATVDIIEELDRQARTLTDVVLAVCFEDRTELISTLDDDRLEHLDRAVAEGGKPLCYLGYTAPTAEDPRFRFCVRRLVEHAHDDWALGAMAELAATFTRSVMDFIRPGEDDEQQTGRLNA